MKWVAIAFLTGAAIPATYGVVAITRIEAYNAAHPLGPNEGGCGLAMLGALGMIGVVSPIVGAICAAARSLAAFVVRKLTSDDESGIVTTPD